MKAKDKIIKFMQAKEDLIYHCMGVKGKYFNTEDQKAIEEWPVELCERVYNEICWDIFDDDAWGLSRTTCPFCVYRLTVEGETCLSCMYANNHGGLNSGGSCCYDWHCLIDNFDAQDLFTNDVYKKILQDIENNDI